MVFAYQSKEAKAEVLIEDHACCHFIMYSSGIVSTGNALSTETVIF